MNDNMRRRPLLCRRGVKIGVSHAFPVKVFAGATLSQQGGALRIGLSQEPLTMHAGINRSRIGQIERGMAIP